MPSETVLRWTDLIEEPSTESRVSTPLRLFCLSRCGKGIDHPAVTWRLVRKQSLGGRLGGGSSRGWVGGRRARTMSRRRARAAHGLGRCACSGGTAFGDVQTGSSATRHRGDPRWVGVSSRSVSGALAERHGNGDCFAPRSGARNDRRGWLAMAAVQQLAGGFGAIGGQIGLQEGETHQIELGVAAA